VIGNKEVPNIDVLHMLAAQSLSILFHSCCPGTKHCPELGNLRLP
jgi:hypothetical protein